MRNRSVTYSSEATFQALADPPAAPCSICCAAAASRPEKSLELFPVSRPAISKHLRLLRRAHLVREHAKAAIASISSIPLPLRAVASWLDQYRTFWKMNLTSLKTFVEAEYVKETKQAAKTKYQNGPGKEMKKKFSICIG